MRPPRLAPAARRRLLLALAALAAAAAALAALLAGRLPPLRRTTKASAKAALIIVDLQRDFLPGGALPVCCASERALVARANRLINARDWAAIVLRRDAHPPGHVSFASSHGLPPRSRVNLTYLANGTLLSTGGGGGSGGGSSSGGGGGGLLFPWSRGNSGGGGAGGATTAVRQTLWPDHCVEGTRGAELAGGLATSGPNVVMWRKGTHPGMDAYSAFRDNGRNVSTGLAAALRAANVTSVWVAGLALDYCAGWTAADALLEGFTSTLVLPATAPVARAGGAAAAARLRAAGVRVLERMPSKRQLRS